MKYDTFLYAIVRDSQFENIFIIGIFDESLTYLVTTISYAIDIHLKIDPLNIYTVVRITIEGQC